MRFFDENSTVWLMQNAVFGGVRIRVPECDYKFENERENGYWYPNETECLKDMEKMYGVMTPYDDIQESER